MSWNTSCSFAKPCLSIPSYPPSRPPLWLLSYLEKVRAKDLIENYSRSSPPQGHVTPVVCPKFRVISLSAKAVAVAADPQTTDKSVNDDAVFQALVRMPSN